MSTETLALSVNDAKDTLAAALADNAGEQFHFALSDATDTAAFALGSQKTLSFALADATDHASINAGWSITLLRQPSPQVQSAGVGVVSADQINTYMQVASNFNQLRNFAAIDGMVAVALGRSYPNDGGQGLFVYSAESQATDDNTNFLTNPNYGRPVGTTATFLGSPGAWVRFTAS